LQFFDVGMGGFTFGDRDRLLLKHAPSRGGGGSTPNNDGKDVWVGIALCILAALANEPVVFESLECGRVKDNTDKHLKKDRPEKNQIYEQEDRNQYETDETFRNMNTA
jgi:hypothetical protein